MQAAYAASAALRVTDRAGYQHGLKLKPTLQYWIKVKLEQLQRLCSRLTAYGAF